MKKGRTSSGGEPRVREVRSSDLDAIKAINRLAPQPWPEEKLSLPFSKVDHHAYVVEKEGELVGYLYYQTRKDDFVLDQIAVHPSQRRKGFARLLGERLKNDHSRAPQQRIVTHVNHDNFEMHSLLGSLGFKGAGSTASAGPVPRALDRYELVKQPHKTPVNVRWMIRRDMSKVLDIENASFEYPWKEEHFVISLRARNIIGMVAEHNDRIVGYMIYELHKDKLEILNFAVDPELRRSGVGEQLVAKLKEKLSSERRRLLAITLREGNTGAREFFAKEGFDVVSEMSGFYSEISEKALRMEFLHGKPDLSPESLQSANHFARLGLPLLVSPERVKQAYAELTRGLSLAPKARELLTEALEVFSDEERRRRYVAETRLDLISRLPSDGRLTIDPGNENFYYRLGLSENANPRQIGRAEEAAIVTHGGDTDAMAALQRAIRVLRDPQTREQYDAILFSTSGEDRGRAVERLLARLENRPPNLTAPSAEEKEHGPRLGEFSKPHPEAAGFYQRLGVGENASRDQILDGYLAAIASTKNERLRRRAEEAFRVLHVPEFRDSYDALVQEKAPGYQKKIRALVSNSPPLNVAAKKSFPPPEFPLVDPLPSVGSAVPGSSNFYQRLGVPENASEERIFEAYRAHSGTLKSKPGQLARVTEAFRILADRKLRARYDDLQSVESEEERAVAMKELVAEVTQPRKTEARATSPENSSVFGVADPSRENFYERLGVSRNVDPQALEAAFLKAVRGRTAEEIHAIEDAYLVLRAPRLRASYDRLLDQTAISATKTQALIADARELETIRRLNRRLEKAEADLPHFVEATAPLVDALGRSPRTAEKYVQTLQEKWKGTKEASLATLAPLVGLLEKLKARYGTPRPSERMERFHGKVLELRGEVAEALTGTVRSAEELQRLSQLYGELRPGDLVSHILQEKRKQLLSEPGIVEKCLRVFKNFPQGP